MKRLITLFTVSFFVFSCSNESGEKASSADSVVTAPVNSQSNPNYQPGSNIPGQGTGNGDTASYEGMNQKPLDSTRNN